MKEVGIGLLGFGTVGAGVVEGLQRNAELLARRTGVRLVLRWIADLDLSWQLLQERALNNGPRPSRPGVPLGATTQFCLKNELPTRKARRSSPVTAS